MPLRCKVAPRLLALPLELPEEAELPRFDFNMPVPLCCVLVLDARGRLMLPPVDPDLPLYIVPVPAVPYDEDLPIP